MFTRIYIQSLDPLATFFFLGFSTLFFLCNHLLEVTLEFAYLSMKNDPESLDSYYAWVADHKEKLDIVLALTRHFPTCFYFIALLANIARWLIILNPISTMKT